MSETLERSITVSDIVRRDHKIAILCPINDAAQRTTALELARELCLLYGGCTTSEAYGYWLDDDGNLIHDRILHLWAYCTASDMRRCNGRLMRLIDRVKRDTAQSSLAYIIDGQLSLF